MTATMLEGRRDKLEAIGLRYANGLSVDGGDESELRRAADHPRYVVRRVDDQDAAEEAVCAALRERERVLWVVNTVDRCQRIAKQFAADASVDALATDDGVPLYCYHTFVPEMIDADGQRAFAGYTLAIPDVSDPTRFAQMYKRSRLARTQASPLPTGCGDHQRRGGGIARVHA